MTLFVVEVAVAERCRSAKKPVGRVLGAVLKLGYLDDGGRLRHLNWQEPLNRVSTGDSAFPAELPGCLVQQQESRLGLASTVGQA